LGQDLHETRRDVGALVHISNTGNSRVFLFGKKKATGLLIEDWIADLGLDC
jgi:hypothetical protein